MIRISLEGTDPPVGGSVFLYMPINYPVTFNSILYTYYVFNFSTVVPICFALINLVAGTIYRGFHLKIEGFPLPVE